MSVLAHLELAEWTVRHLRWHDILGTHVLHAHLNRAGAGWKRFRARIEDHEQKFWERMYGDEWLPETKCNPHLPEEELRRALGNFETQIPLLRDSVARTDAKLRAHGLMC